MTLTLTDLLPNDTFVVQRRRLEAGVLQAKGVRRLALGTNMTLLFENHATCLWQVQEMCRVEGITAPAAIQHELDTYNALLPGPAELSATLLIAVDDPAARSAFLHQLVGLHHAVALQLDGEPPAPARFDGEQFNAVRVSAVQFLRIALTASQIVALRDLGRSATLACTHPAYAVASPLPLTLRAALAEDLARA